MAFPITPTTAWSSGSDLFDLKLYERQDALPRAYVAGAATVLDDDGAPPAGSPTGVTVPRNEVVLAPSASARAAPAVAGGGPGDQAIMFEVERARAGAASSDRRREQYLVLSDSWYPGLACNR